MMTRREAIQRTAALLGLSLSPAALTRVLAQAQSTAAAGPQYLSATHFALTTAVADTLLPRTDTPGASDVGVPAFMDLSYGEYYSAAQRELFAIGLMRLNQASTVAHDRAFIELNDSEKAIFLSAYGAEAADDNRAFLLLFRRTAMLGFYTSEEVSKTMFNYDPIPGRLDADIPLAEVGGKAWSS